MVSGYIAILLAFVALVNITIADFEHTCSDSDYYEGRSGATMTVCGQRLAMIVQRMCADKGGIHFNKRDVSSVLYKSHTFPSIPADISRTPDQAKAFLSHPSKRGNANQGIVCECCVNRCTTTELNQYCAQPNSRRRRRSIKLTAPTKQIPLIDDDEALNRFYEELENMDVDPNAVMSIEELERQPIVRLIELQKVKNIQQGSTKRGSSETTKVSEDEVDSSNSLLREFLRRKLFELLSKIQTSSTTHQPIERPEEPLTDEEKQILHDLFQLFKSEIDVQHHGND